MQVAGTPSITQIPFFITSCDYTIIGDEFYAASAYLSREPTLLGSLVGQDYAKAVLMHRSLAGHRDGLDPVAESSLSQPADSVQQVRTPSVGAA